MRKILETLGIVHLIRWTRSLFGVTPETLSRKYFSKMQPWLIKNYMSQPGLKKLQIGAQSNSIEGWLNVDLEPKEEHVVYMDATKPFPFKSNSVDYVFSEHMIEHVSFEEADFMLSECMRILKPEGKIRLATPNILTVANILIDPDHSDHQVYIKHYHDRFMDRSLPIDPVYVVNKLFYSFDHRFIHGSSTLNYLLSKHGFKTIEEFPVGKSDDPVLTGIEQHANEMGEIPNKVETLVIQAIKNA